MFQQEGASKTIGGKTYVFSGGKWRANAAPAAPSAPSPWLDTRDPLAQQDRQVGIQRDQSALRQAPYDLQQAQGQAAAAPYAGPKAAADLANAQSQPRHQAFSERDKIRSSYEGTKEYQSYRAILPMFEAAVRAADNPAGDLNLVTAWAKVVDPTGVVRESDVSMAENTQKLIDSIYAQKSNLDGSGRLRPEARKNLINEMRARGIAAARSFLPVYRVYRDEAARLGNPDEIIGPHPGQLFQDVEADVIGRPVRNWGESDEQYLARTGIQRGNAPKLSDDEYKKQLRLLIQRGDRDGALRLMEAQGQEMKDPAQLDAAIKVRDATLDLAPTEQYPNLRGLGIGLGDVAEGVGDIVGLVTNPFNTAVNTIFGTKIPTDMGETFRSYTGMPEPETSQEQFISSVNKGGVGALGMSGFAGGAANFARGAIQQGLRRFGAMPAQDAVAGMSGAGSADAARQNGAGPVGQFAAGLAGGGLAGLGANAAASRFNPSAVAPAAVPPQVSQQIAAAQAAQALNIRMPRFVAGGMTAQNAGRTLEQSPLGRAPISGAVDSMIGDARNARDRIAASVGRAVEPEAMGETALRGGNAGLKSAKAKAQARYTQAEKLAQGVTIAPQATIQKLGELARADAAVPGGTKLTPILKHYADAFSGGGPITVAGAREMRSTLRERFQNEGGLSPSNAKRLTNQIMEAVNTDVATAFQRAGKPQGIKAYAEADKGWAQFSDLRDDVLIPFIGKDGDRWGSEVAARINQDIKGNPARIHAFLNAMPKEAADEVRATLISRLGRAGDGAQDETSAAFSLDVFLTNWNQIKASSKLIFGPETKRDLDRLAQVAARAKATNRSRNTSNTGASIWATGTMAPATMGLGGSAVSGSALPVIGGVLSTLFAAVGQYGGAKLLASPNFAKKLANTPANAAAARRYWSGDWVQQMARTQPVIANDLLGYQQTVIRALNDNLERPVAASQSDEEERRQRR